MGRDIGEEELKTAKEKLACHIQPPGHAKTEQPEGGSSAAPVSPDDFIGPDGRVYLTRMTTAGG
jgi:hypothetical protein